MTNENLTKEENGNSAKSELCEAVISNDKLLPCPFCGGKNLFMRKDMEYDVPSINDSYLIGCLSVDDSGWICGAQLTSAGNKKQVIQKWNNRVK